MEVWRPVVGHEQAYAVSDQGNVRSIDRVIIDALGRRRRLRGQPLAPIVSPPPYLSVNIGRGNPRMIHVLVLETFVGPRPSPKHDGCHDDGNYQRNALTNLRWDTRQANSLDTVRHGRNRLAAQQRCKRGHLLAEPNLVACLLAKGWRGCLACNRADANVRHHPELNMQTQADLHYARLMDLPRQDADWRPGLDGKLRH